MFSWVLLLNQTKLVLMSSSWYGLGVQGEAEAGTPAPGSGAVPCPIGGSPFPSPALPFLLQMRSKFQSLCFILVTTLWSIPIFIDLLA